MQRIQLTPSELASAQLNGFSIEDKWSGVCRDCEEHSDDLYPYKYEPNTFLCEGCREERMADA
jgi:hypothetical protein